MSAGNSDYTGVAQSGIGQGFAQGTQMGIDAYNKGVDRKAAQANTYLTQFIGPNLQKLSVGIPRPPAGAPQSEIDAWVKAENARRAQVDLLLGQSEKYLKATGSPLSKDEWAGLFYDPNSALSADDWGKIQKSYGQYGSLDAQAKVFQQQLAGLDPTSEAYQTKLAEYTKFKSDTGYENIWSDINGVKYQEFVGSEAFTKAVRQDKVRKNDETFLQGVIASVKDPAVQSLANKLIADGISLDTINPDTGKSYREQLQAAIDGEGLDNLINSGDPKGINAALQRISAMTDSEKQNLSPAAKQLWSQFMAYQKDPNAVDMGPNKQAFQNFTLVDQSVSQGQNTIKIQGLDISYKTESLTLAKQQIKLNDINIDATERENIWKFGAIAAEGNSAVLASKDEFFGLLGDMPAAEKEKVWQASVLQPLSQYEKKQTQNFQYVEQQLTGMTLSNTSQIETQITAGTLHLTGLYTTDQNGNVIVDKSSKIYQTIKAVAGDVPDATLMAWYARSETNFQQLDDKKKQDLRIGAANVRSAEANATSSETEAKWSELFASQKWEAGNYANITAKVQAEIAPAQAKGQLSVLMGQAVKTNGVGILQDPEFKKMFTDVLGETGYANAAVYLQRQQEYETKVQKNQLTVQGQQITQANNDEFDRMFKSPESIRMYMAQPDKVAAIARAAGISPEHAMSALTQLDREKRTLTDLQIRSVRFDMYARQQGIDLQVRQQGLDENYRWNRANAADAQWSASFNRGVYESDRAFNRGVYEDNRDYNANQTQLGIQNGFTSRQIALDYARFDDMRTFRNMEFNTNVVRDARDYALRVRAQTADEQASVRQFQAMFLTPLNEKLNIVQSQLDAATKGYNDIVASQSGAYQQFIGANVVWTKQKDGTFKAQPKNAAAQATFNLLAQNGTIGQLESAYNRRNNLEIELDNGKTLYNNIMQQGTQVLGQLTADVPAATSSVQLASKPSAVSKQNFATYQSSAPTKQGAAIAGFVQSAVSGKQTATYPNITKPGYCTTFVQAMMSNTMNVPGGIPAGGLDGANGFMAGLLAKGANLYSGSGAGGTLSVNDIKNLPDGTILFQKDGTREGHTGIVLGGMVVQNSRYKDNKINGAIGTMSLDQFVKSANTFAVQVPDSWYKGGTGANPRAASIGTPGGTSSKTPKTATTTAQNTPIATTPRAIKYGSTDGSFLPDMPAVGTFVASQVNKGKGVRVAASPGGNSGLSLKTGEGRYAIITNDTVAMQAVGRVSTQFGIFFSQSQGASLSTAYKQNPQQVRNALVVELKNAGFTGNLNRYVDMWIKSKGWR